MPSHHDGLGQSLSRVAGQMSAVDAASAVDPMHAAEGGHAIAVSGYGQDQCCPGVVDPFTLLSVLAGIGAVALFLRQTSLSNTKVVGKKKRSSPIVLKTADFSMDLLAAGKSTLW
jgi:hypothetical protein